MFDFIEQGWKIYENKIVFKYQNDINMDNEEKEILIKLITKVLLSE